MEKSGHLQINKNVLHQLVDLHDILLKDPRFPEYTAEFYKTLPYIVELRSKAGTNPAGEIETCFNALYGMLMLRLAGKEISPETQVAIARIAKFIAVLAHNFHLDEADKLFPHKRLIWKKPPHSIPFSNSTAGFTPCATASWPTLCVAPVARSR